MNIFGEISLPGDKSLIHRYIFLASSLKGTSVLSNIILSEDIKVSIEVMKSCGIKISILNDKVYINGSNLRSPNKKLNCRESGTSARLLFGFLTGHGINGEILGEGNLNNRPMQRLITPLIKMNANIEKKRYLPIKVSSSSLNSIDFKLNIPSAQLKTSLLFAAYFSNNSIHLKGKVQSRDHTELLLKAFGAQLIVKNNSIFLESNQFYNCNNHIKANVPGDISSAAFLIVLSIVSTNSKLLLKNILLNKSRSSYIHILKNAGAKIEIRNIKKIMGEDVGDILIRNSKLSAINVNSKTSPHVIDEIPALAIAALFCKEKSRFEGLKELIYKESNRLDAILENINMVGGVAKRSGYSLIISPIKRMHNTTIKTMSDHRIAMAFKVLGMLSKKNIVLDNESCINKSFPEFINLTNKLCHG